MRLKRYAGMEKGYTSIAELAQARTRERLGESGLRRPFKDELEKNLGNGPRYVDGIAKLFTKYQIKGWEKPYQTLKTQLAAHDDFVRKEILPQARTDFRQPAELYSHSLEQFGVDMPVEELQSRAKTAFQGDAARHAGARAAGGEGEGLGGHRLPRRDQGAQEVAAPG